MKRYYPLLVCIILIFGACKGKEKEQNQASTAPSNTAYLNDEQLQIIKAVQQEIKANMHVSNTCRNRYVHKKDLSELTQYLKTAGEKYTADSFYFNKADELFIDTSKDIDQINWINDDDIVNCRSKLKDLWPCMKKKYGIEEFFYFSIPLFSPDKKYALISVNFVSVDDSKSYGGGRLYKKEDGKWKEIAFLTGWGKLAN